MVGLEQLAEAALAGEALALRSLVQDFLRGTPLLADCPRPARSDARVWAVSAALVELLAERSGQAGPRWTRNIGPLPELFYLLRAASTMRRLREMCEVESPLPLRRRNPYAPAEFLRFA